MTKYFCDRCEREITGEAHQLSYIKDIDLLSPSGEVEATYILCTKCINKLVGWMQPVRDEDG